MLPVKCEQKKHCAILKNLVCSAFTWLDNLYPVINLYAFNFFQYAQFACIALHMYMVVHNSIEPSTSFRLKDFEACPF